ncbi:hypothetical protein J7K56_04930, partial [Candidatus Calescamantes bacterium]|nr:hypothetical protein [Candidatus Calescamantes bacterium]
MRRGFKCKKKVFEDLKREYNQIVINKFNQNFLEALKQFDSLAENQLRGVLIRYYQNQRSRDSAWRTCKGSLYEYAVFRYIQQILEKNKKLKDKIFVMIGDEASNYKDQIVIQNWGKIFPDVDILIIEKDTQLVKAILS